MLRTRLSLPDCEESVLPSWKCWGTDISGMDSVAAFGLHAVVWILFLIDGFHR